MFLITTHPITAIIKPTIVEPNEIPKNSPTPRNNVLTSNGASTNVAKVLYSTIATASFNTDSPKTIANSKGSAFSSGAPKIASVATGSVALINEPNSIHSNG